MARVIASPILQCIRRLAEDEHLRGLSDAELFRRFHAQQDQAAFHGLLRRHGVMVLDVCRSVLGNEADAEDAFQATFLILARRGASIRNMESLASWLYGVAQRTALKARAKSGSRRKHEARVPERSAPVADDLSWREVRRVLHEELNGLPERYRAPLVLCYLEGVTQEAAAAQLGLARRTLRERLERARALFRARLLRRGLGPTVALTVAGWPAANASASVPLALLASTLNGATHIAEGGAATAAVPAKVAALAEGVIKAMLLTKLKTTLAGLLLVAALVSGAGLIYQTRAAEQTQAQPAAEAADKDKQPVPAGDEKQKALADFAARYALKPGEVLKRVATPFPPSRFAYHRQHYPKDDKAQDMMFLSWDNDLHFRGTIGGIKSDPRKVQLVFLLRWLPSMIGALDVLGYGRELEVRGDQDLLLKTVEGDFVARTDVPFDKIVARLGEILRDECKLPVKLTLLKDRGAYTLLVENQREAARSQSSYSIRSVIRVMPPYNLQALNDDYQDVRVRRETKDFVELEVISHPLNTNADAITENRSWKHDYAGMKEYLNPGVTTNWDAAMQKDVLAELSKSGIYPDKVSDKQAVEQVSRWLLGRCKYRAMFGIMYADFREGKPVIFPRLEKAFEREKGDPAWTVEDEFAHELFGKGMFYNRCRGSCTSSAVLLATVLRALGIPTRIIVAIPLVDQNDPEQVALVKNNLRHDRVRTTIMNGLLRISQGFANHTYNEVFVGNRWRRLNYAKLGQNILDETYFGLMIHVHTFNDLSEARFAPTWGRRYALGLRDEQFKYGNPYRTLEISEHFGRDGKVPSAPAVQHKTLTITRASWLESKHTPEIIRQRARRPKEGEAHLYVHAAEWFPDQDREQYLTFLKQADRSFVFRAKGRPDVQGQVQLSFWADGSTGLRDILLVIPKGEYAKMATGVRYTIHPLNAVTGYRWQVKDGLTITREASWEEKLDRLQQRVDKLDRRVRQLEKRHATP